MLQENSKERGEGGEKIEREGRRDRKWGRGGERQKEAKTERRRGEGEKEREEGKRSGKSATDLHI